MKDNNNSSNSNQIKPKDKLPIVVQKGNWSKKKKPNLFRDINLHDKLDGFDFLFEKTSGKIVSKSDKKMLLADDLDPKFQVTYSEALNGPELNKHLKFHPDTNKESIATIKELVKEYWCCFCKANIPIPLQEYKCHIDTGKAKPNVTRAIYFGLNE
jgi:hypothetical protein